MMEKKVNFLNYIPRPAGCIRVAAGEDGFNHLEILHEGWADRAAQKLLKKPVVTHVALERFGSFIWQQIDGKHSIYEIALMVKETFGEEAEPLYERLTAYFCMLKQKGYITLH